MTTIRTLANAVSVVATAVQVSGAQGREGVEAEHHALRVEREIQRQRNHEHGEDEPQLLVHGLQSTDGRCHGICFV
jgi:hypothetical protein